MSICGGRLRGWTCGPNDILLLAVSLGPLLKILELGICPQYYSNTIARLLAAALFTPSNGEAGGLGCEGHQLPDPPP
ncbi:hypothetical protein [Methylobacterium nigriterrae]|uniref:hypothetical protein n=1 Tax=Methylobacterium nigriterrae TaxID=3127512 RepID=UPI0030137215